MNNASNTSSQQELEQLRNEGKVSETDYRELLEAMNKPASDQGKPSGAAEPQVEEFRVHLLTFSLATCVIGLPIGLMLEVPFVWVLSILGLIVNPVKLSRIESSWLAKMINKRKRPG